MGVPPINFGGFSNQSAFQQYQPTILSANVIGGQEGANQISETLTSESTKQLKIGIPTEVADNTKKETKLATMDEDGEHNPEIIENMIEKLELENYDIVYARFKHKKFDFRETLSKQSKKFISFIAKDENINLITSYRAVRGSVFRSAAVYANNGSFLDIALSWISNRVSTVETEKRDSHRDSTYTLSKLVKHFNKLFFAAGIRPLIFLFNIGWITSLGSLLAIGVIVYRKIFSDIEVQGWVSSITVILFIGGIMISAIGLVARYLSAIVETSSGKPFFTIKNK